MNNFNGKNLFYNKNCDKVFYKNFKKNQFKFLLILAAKNYKSIKLLIFIINQNTNSKYFFKNR